jgi:hypothetical protein
MGDSKTIITYQDDLGCKVSAGTDNETWTEHLNTFVKMLLTAGFYIKEDDIKEWAEYFKIS